MLFVGSSFLLLLAVVFPADTPDQATVVGEGQDPIMRAMADELQRSVDGLTLDDLPKPYFIQFRADDRYVFTAQAYYGGLTQSDERRARSFRSRVRVGSYDSDNTNVGGGGGSGATLPLDDDYQALRHAIWAAVDRDYKRAVEVLTRKQAYLRDKNIEDRPPDFSTSPPVQWSDPPAHLSIDRKDWEDRIEKLSARFRSFPQILESAVSIFAGTSNEYVVNTEGTRLGVADTGVLLTIDAALQAEEGMWLRNGRTFLREKPQELPPLDELLAAIDTLCKDLIALSRAPMCDHYAGPVLFEPVAAGKMFAAVLGDGLCARPVPLGRKAAPGASLENKLGLRILPHSFQAYDDPTDRTFNGTLLAGAYEYDDEAVHAERVSLVENGILKNLLSSRSPTKKISRSNGHGRSGSLGDARARVGCLYVVDKNGASPEQLKRRLIEAAREEGLAYGLRIKSMEDGAHGVLGKPIYAYKVYVDDGREELVRGLEFLPVETRALKHILAGGTQQEVYNDTSSVVKSFIAPAVILEDLELSKLQKEFNKLPILKAPDARN